MSTPEGATSAAGSAESTNRLVDLISAMHHPLRRRLLSLLWLDGPGTVSKLAEATGERVGNISHHMKVLGDAGLAEEAPERARDRREHWWRANPTPISWSTADFAGDPVGEVVASAAEQQNLAYHMGKVQEWYAHREAYDPVWSRAAFSDDGWLAVTPDELSELSDKINALMNEYGATPDRVSDPRRQRVFVFAHGVPAEP